MGSGELIGVVRHSLQTDEGLLAGRQEVGALCAEAEKLWKEVGYSGTPELITIVRKLLTNNDDLLSGHRTVGYLCDLTEELWKIVSGQEKRA